MTALLTIVAAILVSASSCWYTSGGISRRPALRRPGGGICHRFGPAVWKHTGKDDTLYSIRLLPLGGYNMMAGYIDPDDLEEDESGRIRVRPDAESQPPIKKPRGAPVCPTPSTARPTRKPRRGSDFLSLPAAR